jgi:hypothetical protein
MGMDGQPRGPISARRDCKRRNPRGRAAADAARGSPKARLHSPPRGSRLRVPTKSPCATGEARGRARTAGTATTPPASESHQRDRTHPSSRPLASLHGPLPRVTVTNLMGWCLHMRLRRAPARRRGRALRPAPQGSSARVGFRRGNVIHLLWWNLDHTVFPGTADLARPHPLIRTYLAAEATGAAYSGRAHSYAGCGSTSTAAARTVKGAPAVRVEPLLPQGELRGRLSPSAGRLSRLDLLDPAGPAPGGSTRAPAQTSTHSTSTVKSDPG